MSRYRFIEAEKRHHAVAIICRVLKVSRAAYYKWCQSPVSRRSCANSVLLERIRKIHEASDGQYGSPRITVELQDQGHRAGENRVARLMRAGGLRGRCGRRKCRTTIPAKTPAPFEDLVRRQFAADQPNQLWCGDVTYIRTWEGWLYLASVIDVYSRRCLGWAIADHMRSELVCDALKMAITNRGGASSGVIFHSDRGSQYGSGIFMDLCSSGGVRQSMGRVADCFDNALAESFFATFKCELIYTRSWPTKAGARSAIVHWIEATYNRRRRHSSIGMLAPVTFEGRYFIESDAA